MRDICQLRCSSLPVPKSASPNQSMTPTGLGIHPASAAVQASATLMAAARKECSGRSEIEYHDELFGTRVVDGPPSSLHSFAMIARLGACQVPSSLQVLKLTEWWRAQHNTRSSSDAPAERPRWQRDVIMGYIRYTDLVNGGSLHCAAIDDNSSTSPAVMFMGHADRGGWCRWRSNLRLRTFRCAVCQGCPSFRLRLAHLAELLPAHARSGR
jgi:hypothetical protein